MYLPIFGIFQRTSNFFLNKLYFLKTLDLQKKCDNSTESSRIPHPVSPVTDSLHYYGMFITISESIWIYYCKFTPDSHLSGFTYCPFPVPGSPPAPHSTFWGHASLRPFCY